jgi:hypothetical protein
MIHVRHLADCAEQAWKNGGGTTRELLSWPPQAPNWTLRLSVARIARDGPFSAYPGVGRWFAVLSGEGVELSWAGEEQQAQPHLRPGTAPVMFDGAEPPGCRLLGGATEDLNLMFKNELCKARLQVAVAGSEWSPAGSWRGLYTALPCRLHAAASMDLPAHSLAWDDSAAPPTWRLETSGPAQAWWMSVENAAT